MDSDCQSCGPQSQHMCCGLDTSCNVHVLDSWCIASVCCVDRLFAFHDLCMQGGQLLSLNQLEMQVTGLTAGRCCKVNAQDGSIGVGLVMAQVESAWQAWHGNPRVALCVTGNNQ